MQISQRLIKVRPRHLYMADIKIFKLCLTNLGARSQAFSGAHLKKIEFFFFQKVPKMHSGRQQLKYKHEAYCNGILSCTRSRM